MKTAPKQPLPEARKSDDVPTPKPGSERAAMRKAASKAVKGR